MLSSFKKSYKTFVFEKDQEGVPVGMLIDYVIEPNTGKFEALWIKTTKGLRLLSPHDISKWTTKKLLIQSQNDLNKPDEFPKIQKTMKKEVSILDAKVWIGKKYIGKVKDFSFDTISPRILGIMVSSGFLWWEKRRIIARSKIKRITSKGIFVHDTKLKTAEKSEKSDKVKGAEVERG